VSSRPTTAVEGASPTPHGSAFSLANVITAALAPHQRRRFGMDDSISLNHNGQEWNRSGGAIDPVVAALVPAGAAVIDLGVGDGEGDGGRG
jgi:hypothetical protein